LIQRECRHCREAIDRRRIGQHANIHHCRNGDYVTTGDG
jgi:hypothetical protein